MARRPCSGEGISVRPLWDAFGGGVAGHLNPAAVAPPPPPQRRSDLRVGVVVAVVVTIVVAVLFVPSWIVAAGLCKGCGGSTLLGSVFEFGTPRPTTVVAGENATPGCGAPTSGTDYCQILPVAEALSGLTTDDFGFVLTLSSGAFTPFATVTLVDASDRGIAQYTGSSGEGTWTACTASLCHAPVSPLASGLPAPVSSTEVFVLQVSPPGGGGAPSGDILNALGEGPYAGSIGVVLV
jgi:hypothetical protein